MASELKKCVLCDGEIVGRIIEWKVELDGKEYLIHDVPVMECEKCGEKYLNPSASRYIDQKIEQIKNGEPEMEVRVREMRKAKNITQEELGKRMGFSIARVSEIERSKKIPSILLALKLAKALDCDVNDLYRLK